MSDDAAAIVKDMAKLVLVSGKISETQIKNMKMFPLIYFDGAKEVKIEYDLSHKADALVDKDSNLTINAPHRNNFVAYYLTGDIGIDNIEKRYAALEASIRTLFWSDVTVEVFINEKISYKSKR